MEATKATVDRNMLLLSFGRILRLFWRHDSLSGEGAFGYRRHFQIDFLVLWVYGQLSQVIIKRQSQSPEASMKNNIRYGGVC